MQLVDISDSKSESSGFESLGGYQTKREYHRAYHYKRGYKRYCLLTELKECKPCADCGIWYPFYVMDFDHVSGKKTQNLASMRTCSRVRIEREIAKCELVCANCHRVRTHFRSQDRMKKTE